MKPELLRWEFQPTVNHETGDITLTTLMPNMNGVMSVISREVLHTKERAFREALIELGWTPPPSGERKGI